MNSMRIDKSKLSDLLETTKDGDWGKDQPEEGFLPYRVIRGTDFIPVRFGNTQNVPTRYLDERTVGRRTLQANDILIETAGGTKDQSTGRSLLITKKMLDKFDLPVTCASFARFLRIGKKKAFPGYIFWYLQNEHENGGFWEYQVQHTGVARFQYTVFANTVDIPLPAIPTQRAIASILGSLDDKIELNRKTCETLEEMARAIFKSWFVDFDPVRAKAAGEKPASICKRLGLTREMLDLFPSRLVDSELGEVPEGWNLVGLDTIATFSNGLALQKYPSNGSGSYPAIKIAQLNAENVDGADLVNRDVPDGYIIHAGDVLFSWSGSLEVKIWTGVDGALNQHLFKVTSHDYPKWFYYQWTLHHLPEFRQIAANKATTMGHIQRVHLSEAKVITPKSDVLRKMDKIMDPILGMSISMKIEQRRLAETRDTLLPKLISGEIEVPVGADA
jgi:type I restriction enzyme, S subunit